MHMAMLCRDTPTASLMYSKNNPQKICRDTPRPALGHAMCQLVSVVVWRLSKHDRLVCPLHLAQQIELPDMENSLGLCAPTHTFALKMSAQVSVYFSFTFPLKVFVVGTLVSFSFREVILRWSYLKGPLLLPRCMSAACQMFASPFRFHWLAIFFIWWNYTF